MGSLHDVLQMRCGAPPLANVAANACESRRLEDGEGWLMA
jgi:hypothetical protein